MRTQIIEMKRVMALAAVAILIVAMCVGCSEQQSRVYTVSATNQADPDMAEGPYNRNGQNNPGYRTDLGQSETLLPNQYHLGSDDILEISIFQLMSPNQEYVVRSQVDHSGCIYLPMLNHVYVEGMTPGQVQQELVARLGRELIRDPRVAVVVQEYASKKIMVLGSVNRPGAIVLDTDSTSLADVLCRAGGIRPGVAGTVEIIRGRCRANSTTTSYNTGYHSAGWFPNHGTGEIVSLSTVFDGGNGRNNPIIYPGDVVRVPQSHDGVFYISGAVKKPGVKTFRRPLSIMQAVTAAGGIRNIAAEGKCRVIRTMADGTETVINFDFKKIRDGKIDNLMLARNDTIVVPTDPVKKFFDDIDRMIRRGIDTGIEVTYDASPVPATGPM